MPSGWVSQRLLDSLSIVLIDLVLAGDNALVIAMAVRVLPERQRLTTMILGAAGSVVLRVVLTILAGQLLGIEFLKLLGGLLVLWIAVKVLVESASPPEAEFAGRNRLLKTVWIIMVADLTMSLDNILAVAGAARGHWPLIVFGLAVSIPLVVFSSKLIAMLMDRYPVIMYLGAALLGKVGAQMALTDPFVSRTLHPSEAQIYWAEAIAVVGVLIAGKVLSSSAATKKKDTETASKTSGK